MQRTITTHIETLAQDTVAYHYQLPYNVLRLYDYDTSILGRTNVNGVCVQIGNTNWNKIELATPYNDMVCVYTGYTRNQMLAAMLNAELADEIELEYSKGVDAIAEAAYEVLRTNWVYPSPMGHSNRVYAQHQANRYMV